MRNNALKQALSKAVAALEGIPEKELQQLSLADCAFILTALPDTEPLARVRALLAERLRGQLNVVRIEQDDAYEIYSMLTALWRYNPTYIASEWLAAAINRLVHSEVAEGGPYYTDNTIAVAPNVQIAVFVSVVAKPLPNMKRFLEAVVAARHFDGPRLTKFTLFYLLATACDSEELAHFVEDNWRHAHWQTPWRQVVSLAVLKDRIPRVEVERTLLAVCHMQDQDGFWKGEPLAKGTRPNHGSSMVTTALMAKALHGYVHTSTDVVQIRRLQRRQSIARAAARIFNAPAEPLRSSALTVTNKICSADNNFEITLLPRFFAEALDPPRDFTKAQYTMLGLANVCIWVAYTIYDDFMDGEGEPAELPVANVAMRASMDCFRAALPGDARFHRYVSEVLTGMDEANAWEVEHCRFMVRGGKIKITALPRYGRRTILATRAFAHALTPMAILALCSTSATKQSHIEIAFRHYLIARQLNDDLHDWAKDIQAGQASYVVTTILRDMRVKHDEYDLDALLPAMQRCFRRTTMPKVCQHMLRHITLSKQHFAKSQLLQPANDIYRLLDDLELSAHHAMDRRAKSQALAGINPV